MKLGNSFWPLAVGVCGLAALAAIAWAGDRDRLRTIVQEQCLPHWLTAHDPAPCASLSGEGYAVLADRKGGAHFLLIPTGTVSGIESPELRAAGAFNYFAAAWSSRFELEGVVGGALPRDAVGLAVNHLGARSQDQLHIHISCLARSVYEDLRAAADHIGPNWSTVRIAGADYYALRIMGAQLGETNPFRLLAERLPGAEQAMGQFTLLVAGMKFKEGPGFVALAGQEVPAAERLLDSTCSVKQQQRQAAQRLP